jgi:hypothetical protein
MLIGNFGEMHVSREAWTENKLIPSLNNLQMGQTQAKA